MVINFKEDYMEREYKKYEYCKDIKCMAFYKGKCRREGCEFGAKHFHKWLKENNFKIVKEEVI
jgi:hypothetical protein